ncbi:MAG: PEGA domain-containing protein [bacterium]|nr:PEGA domain-containing protein [bacterium]
MRSRFWEFWTDPDIAPEIKRGRDQLKAVLLIGFVFALAGGWALYQFVLRDRKALVIVESEPRGAVVQINGIKIGVTPYEFRTNSFGKYTIKVTMQHFVCSPESLVIDVQRKSKSFASFRLIPGDPNTMTETPVAQQPAPRAALPSVFKRGVPQTNPVPERGLGEQEYLKSSEENPRVIDAKYASVRIESDPSGAEVWIDNTPTSKLTPHVATLPLGIHRIVVKKSGYRAIDGEQIVSLATASSMQNLLFQLVAEAQATQGRAFVSTRPINGKVFLDGSLRGTGEVTIEPLAYGEYTLSFGAVEGYRTPAPVHVSITSGNSVATIVGTYEPLLSLVVSIDNQGGVRSGDASILYGVYADGNFTTDNANGPQKKYFKDVNFWSWELGYGYQNRNPAGSDAIELRFVLPDGIDKNNLKLRLFGYATNRSYPFTVSGKTRISVELNGKTVAGDVTPTRNLDREDPPGFDEWRIGNWLQAGENRLIVRTSSSSTAVYLLSRIVIL